MADKEDDMEYFITFPSPVSKDLKSKSTKEDEGFVFINGNEQEREPVIFLLGWLGALDRHLAKYAALYNNKGCITIRYTSPVTYVFWQSGKKLKPIARKLLLLLQDMSLDEHPVFFHSFSNSGSLLYHYISEAILEGVAPSIMLKGCIFDSGPGTRNIFRAVRVFNAVMPGSFWSRAFSSLCLFCYLMGHMFFSIVWTIITGRLTNYPPWCLVQEKMRVPQLFLYSKADKVIPSDDIDTFIAERKKLGVPVVGQCWINSEHVQHYRAYQEEYSNVVHSFLRMCLNRSKKAIPPQDTSIDSEKDKLD